MISVINPHPPLPDWRCVLCCALVALALSASGLDALHAGDRDTATACSAGIRTGDQVWLVSTRHIGCSIDGAQPAIWRYRDGAWAGSDAKEFHESAPRQSVLYIHGNRVGDDEGASGGLAVYRQVIAAHAGQEPVRFVIWSWPASKICGLVKDVRSKAWRADDEAVLLARFLSRIERPRDERWGVIAFSYGARITGGALHLLNGGNLDGYTVEPGERPPFRVTFWAAAAHNDWLLEHGRHESALPLGKKWLNLINVCDESMFRYERLEKCGNPPSLGYVGLTGRNLLPEELHSRWEEWNVSNLVGSTHNYPPYAGSSWIAEHTARCVLGNEP